MTSAREVARGRLARLARVVRAPARDVVVFGGVVVDVHARARGATARGTSARGRVDRGVGGVGLNVACACAATSAARVRLVSACGDDADGASVREAWRARARGRDDGAGVRARAGARTGRVVAVTDESGEIVASVADVGVVERDVDEEWCERFASDARGARVVVIDGNLSARGIRAARRAAATTATWFEPVSVAKAVRIVESGDAGRPMVGVRWCSPNAAELRELANAVRRSWAKGSPMSPCPFNPELEFDAANDALDALASDIATVLAAGCERVVLTLGSLGVIVSSAPDGDASNAEHAHVPAFAVKSVASLIGAGDALVGGAVGALARGVDEMRAIAIGVACASMACERREAALFDVDAREIDRRAAIVFDGITPIKAAVQ